MGNYISASEVKQYSNISYQDLGFASETEYETFLDDLINQVEAFIDDYCRVPRGFYRAGGLSFTEIHDWNEDGIIQARYYPILELVRVELDLAGINQPANWTEISSAYYYAKNEYGIIKIVGKSPGHVENSVRITYTAGYSAVPEDIKTAALTLAKNMLLSMMTSDEIRIGDLTIEPQTPQEVFTAEVKTLLAQYKRRLASTQ